MEPKKGAELFQSVYCTMHISSTTTLFEERIAPLRNILEDV